MTVFDECQTRDMVSRSEIHRSWEPSLSAQQRSAGEWKGRAGRDGTDRQRLGETWSGERRVQWHVRDSNSASQLEQLSDSRNFTCSVPDTTKREIWISNSSFMCRMAILGLYLRKRSPFHAVSIRTGDLLYWAILRAK